MFIAASVALPNRQPRNIKLFGRVIKRWKRIDLQRRLALWTDASDLTVSEQPVGQGTGAPWANNQTRDPLLINYSCIADMVMQGALFCIEGSNDVADVKGKAA